MKQGTASETAYLAGLARALHQSDHPCFFRDPVARHFVRAEDAGRLGKPPGKLGFRAKLRGALAARSRLTEDLLHEAFARGTRQYVILGAGFDTYALRSPHLSQGLRVFEVDHPDTQAAKRQLASASGLALPDNLRWAPADFSRQGLHEVLQSAGFDFTQPAFFAMLGVSMYLQRAAMLQTFEAIARGCAKGSEIVFDYVVPPATLSLPERIGVKLLQWKVARLGEPMLNFMDDAELPAMVRAVGFSSCENLEMAPLIARVRAEHKLPASARPPRFGMGRIARAVV